MPSCSSHTTAATSCSTIPSSASLAVIRGQHARALRAGRREVPRHQAARARRCRQPGLRHSAAPRCPGPTFACAADATASGKSYRLAIEFESPDGAGWQGAARDAQGKLWTLYFDADPAAPAGTGNTLSVVPCSEIRFATPGDDVIQCKPILGLRQ